MRILYFSNAENLAGTSEETWEPPSEALTEAAFWEEAIRRHPRLATIRNICRLARNERFLAPDECLLSGDEVAVIPPVSGG